MSEYERLSLMLQCQMLSGIGYLVKKMPASDGGIEDDEFTAPGRPAEEQEEYLKLKLLDWHEQVRQTVALVSAAIRQEHERQRNKGIGGNPEER